MGTRKTAQIRYNRCMLRSTGTAALATLLTLAATGCEEEDVAVFGRVLTTDSDLTRYGDTVNLRAVPDHIDGFEPDQPYSGPRVMSATCPLDHTPFPLDFALFGDHEIVDNAPPRWVVLAWIGDDEDETWVSPGQIYGTTTFEFGRDAFAGGLVIDLDQVYGAR